MENELIKRKLSNYFSVGTTIPLSITFWKQIKTKRVGIAAMIRDAKTTPWPENC